jgi:chloramphenicol 3-O phosphotransferase
VLIDVATDCSQADPSTAKRLRAILNRGSLRDTVPMRGELIALVGTSSVGKTSVSEQLQPMLPQPHLVVRIDHFLNMFPHHWSGQPRGPGPGMWYHDTIDPDGSPRARIRYGSAGKRLLAGMRAAVRAMLDFGNHIIFGRDAPR